MTFLIRSGKCICNAIKLPAARASCIANNFINPPPVYRNYSQKQSLMMADKTLPQIFKYVDANVDSYKKLLKEAVAIPSVSCDVKYRKDCVRMVEWMQEKLKEVGATTELRDVGYQTIDGKEVKLPPVLIGVLGNDASKQTICVYGHLDVQPALKSDGWATEPFELVERDGKLFGRGSTDDKGPVLGWVHAINAYKAVGEELPVNLKFVFECMEESGSEGLDALLLEKLKPEGFFKDVDFVCISDNYWLGTTKPCITYGLRGISYYFLEIECAQMDLHSGVYGGTVHEAMTDLIYLMNELVDKNGKILIDGIYNSVAPLTENEKKLYTNIDFDTDGYRKSIGAPKLAHNGDKEQILLHRWRFPSLSLHGIEGAAFQPGAKTVIPGKVIGKFSIRIVPNQEPEEVEKLVFDFINKKWAARGSPNKMRITAQSGRAWTENPNHPHYQAAARATRMIYLKWWSPEIALLRKEQIAARRLYTRHRRRRTRLPNSEAIEAELCQGYKAAKAVMRTAIVRAKIQAREKWLLEDPYLHHLPRLLTEPDMSREGGSIPVTITLQEASGRNVLLLPMGAGDDMAHSQNEKINVRNYIEGIKLFAAYFYEVSKLPKATK